MRPRFALPILLAAMFLVALWWRDAGPRAPVSRAGGEPSGDVTPGLPNNTAIRTPILESSPGERQATSGVPANRLRLRVKVLDEQSGSEIPEAQVYVSVGGKTRWEVNREGGVAFDLDCTEGGTDVSVSAARAADSTIWETVSACVSPTAPETLVIVRLGSGSTARVRVTDEGGKPIEGATVEVSGLSLGGNGEERECSASGKTSPLGDVEIPGIDPKRVAAIVVQAHKFVGKGVDAPECLEAFRTWLIVRLTPSWRISGQVVDAAGRPVSGASISYRQTIVFGDWRGTRTIDGYPHVETGEDGAFEFYDSLESRGSIEFYATVSSYAPGRSLPIAVVQGSSLEGVRIELRPAGRLHLILHDQLGRPYSGPIVVRPDGPSDRDWQRLRSNENGELLVDSLDPDLSYVIEAKPSHTLSGKKAGGTIELETTKPEANIHRLTVNLPK